MYREHDAQLTASREQLAHQLRSAEASAALAQLGALQGPVAAQVLAATASSGTVGATLPQFAQMSALAQRIAVQSKVEMDAQIAGIQRRTAESQRLLLWQSGLLFRWRCLPSWSSHSASAGRCGGSTAPSASWDAATSPTHQRERSEGHRAAGRQLEWLRGRLLDFAAERNRFLRHMSHELKTPLANIREGTELLMDGAVGELDSNQREVTGILRKMDSNCSD